MLVAWSSILGLKYRGGYKNSDATVSWPLYPSLNYWLVPGKFIFWKQVYRLQLISDWNLFFSFAKFVADYFLFTWKLFLRFSCPVISNWIFCVCFKNLKGWIFQYFFYYEIKRVWCLIILYFWAALKILIFNVLIVFIS